MTFFESDTDVKRIQDIFCFRVVSRKKLFIFNISDTSALREETRKRDTSVAETVSNKYHGGQTTDGISDWRAQIKLLELCFELL